MADETCPRCKAHDDAVPPEMQLRLLVSEDGPEMEAFMPRATTGEQQAALAAYARGLSMMIGAFGMAIAGARVGRSLNMLRACAQLSRVLERVDAARAPIDAELRGRFQRGEIGGAEANAIARQTPTPDYDGRDRDEAWLMRVFGEGVDAL